MEILELSACFPEKIRDEILAETNAIREIRMRTGRRTELVCDTGRRFVGENMDAALLRKAALCMMDYSYYSREAELSKGFFTMKDGCRVGVCGTFVRSGDGSLCLQSIGSLCIRIAREIKGCALTLVEAMMEEGRLGNALIISRPGMGKTTLLRDAARLMSEMGYAVAIADERHEIAACCDGSPTLDVGPRTDVSDGCEKYAAMEMLVRTMSPEILIADEIGCEADAAAVREASRRGVTVLTSAHASGIEDLKKGPLCHLFEERIFSTIALLEEIPGKIVKIWRF